MLIPSDVLLKENIQKNMVFYRKRSNVTQKGLADLIGSAATTVSGWERGVSTPDIDTLCAICNALNVNLYDMCGIIEENMNLSADENKLLNIYKSLNTDGQRRLIERAEELRDLGYVKGKNVKMA